jgi:hypothetical protein
LKGVLQNFGVLIGDTLFIRIDTNSYNISKRIFKNFDKLDPKYTVCLATDRISRLMTTMGYDSDDFIEDLPSIFHLYIKELMLVFDENNINFKELIFNSVGYFDCFEDFEIIMIDNEKSFWGDIKSRYSHTINWRSSSQLPAIKLNALEEREFDESEWLGSVVERKRSNLIDQILAD